MANNLRKFQTEADYSAATLSYPAVSWVTSGDTVHFDKSGSTPTVNDKIIACGLFGQSGNDVGLSMYNEYATTSPSTYFSSITVNDVELNPITSNISRKVEANEAITAKYGVTSTAITDCFATEILGGSSPSPDVFEFLIPSQITSIESFPMNLIDALVIEATTPPTIESSASSSLQLKEDGKIYVPDSAVNTYKSASVWGDYTSRIYPISEYQGNLPV